MTEERVLQLIESYGADPIRWPSAERAAAQTFLAAHDTPALRAALAEAEALDGLLAEMPAPTLSDAAWAQLQAQAQPQGTAGILGRLRRLVDWPGPLWQPAGAMGLSLVLGAWLGLSGIGETSVLPTLPFLGETVATPTESVFVISDSEEVGL